MRRVLVGFVPLVIALAAFAQPPQASRFIEKGPFVAPKDAPEFAADRVIVKFASEISPGQIDRAFAPLGASWLESGVNHAFDVLRVKPGTVAAWVDLLSKLPGVEFAEPDYVTWIAGTPNDTEFFPYQWNFYDYGVLSNGYASDYGVQGMTAWDTTNGSGTTVAVVDSGVSYENYDVYAQAPDLAGVTFVAPYDFVNGDSHANDDNQHGTHVCGTVCQTTNNSSGCAGLAYGCQIMPVKVLGSDGTGQYSWLADGIRWAADNGATVINISIVGSSPSSALQSAVDYAWGKGCVLCAAAGNTGGNRIQFPAACDNCIAVGATRFDGKRCSYSSWGNGLDVMAPGGDSSVDQNSDGYGDGILQQTFLRPYYTTFWSVFMTGTSMATPHVSAIAALVKSNHGSYTNADIRNAIESTCKDLDRKGYDTKTGWGLVNAAAAIN